MTIKPALPSESHTLPAAASFARICNQQLCFNISPSCVFPFKWPAWHVIPFGNCATRYLTPYWLFSPVYILLWSSLNSEFPWPPGRQSPLKLRSKFAIWLVTGDPARRKTAANSGNLWTQMSKLLNISETKIINNWMKDVADSVWRNTKDQDQINECTWKASLLITTFNQISAGKY